MVILWHVQDWCMAPETEHAPDAFFQQLLHVHQAEDAFYHEVEDVDDADGE